MRRLNIQRICILLMGGICFLSCSSGKETLDKEIVGDSEIEMVESEDQEKELSEKILLPNTLSNTSMDSLEKISPRLTQKLKGLGSEESIEILAYPSGTPDELEEVLVDFEKEKILSFRYLELAECYWVKTTKDGVYKLAQSEQVKEIRENPSFSTD